MDATLTRRDALRTTATAAVALAGLPSPATASDHTIPAGWFENVSNYDGVVDKTGQSEVTVEVGAQGNGGAFAFGPAAVRVDPGTTVVWEWTGEGGAHNVVDNDGAFESDLADEAGFTFEHTFEDPGAWAYYCLPHQAMGMKGGILVGPDATVATATATPEGGGEGTPTPTDGTTAPEEGGGGDGGSGGGGGGGGFSFASEEALSVGLAALILAPLAFMFGKSTEQ